MPAFWPSLRSLLSPPLVQYLSPLLLAYLTSMYCRHHGALQVTEAEELAQGRAVRGRTEMDGRVGSLPSRGGPALAKALCCLVPRAAFLVHGLGRALS